MTLVTVSLESRSDDSSYVTQPRIMSDGRRSDMPEILPDDGVALKCT
jgi:hypothetical protein